MMQPWQEEFYRNKSEVWLRREATITFGIIAAILLSGFAITLLILLGVI